MQYNINEDDRRGGDVHAWCCIGEKEGEAFKICGEIWKEQTCGSWYVFQGMERKIF